MLLYFMILYQSNYEMLHIWDCLQNCYILKIKLLRLQEHEKNCSFLKCKLLHLWEYLNNRHFLLKVLHFLENLQIFQFQYKSCKKLKLFNQPLQSQLIVTNILVSLNYLKLLIIFNFLDIFQKHCGVSIFVTCANSIVKIYDLWPLSMNLHKLNAFLLYKTCTFELKQIFFFTVTKKMAITVYLSLRNDFILVLRNKIN